MRYLQGTVSSLLHLPSPRYSREISSVSDLSSLFYFLFSPYSARDIRMKQPDKSRRFIARGRSFKHTMLFLSPTGPIYLLAFRQHRSARKDFSYRLRICSVEWETLILNIPFEIYFKDELETTSWEPNLLDFFPQAEV